MTPERWQKLDELFHAALEREGDARVAFIAQATGEDAEMRRELESMVAHHEKASSFIESPAYAVAAETMIANDLPEQLIGTTLGPYRILNVLGTGGMGVVYRALDLELQRKVALKFLHPELTSDKSRILRFKQEARAASALNHPNILTVLAIGEIDGRHYISTELVDGETLRELMKSRRMSLGQVFNVASQISSALSAAHAAGIMHRDIKPENIMLRPDGYLKVLDFGVAKLIEPSPSDSGLSTLINTEQGMIIGTIQYMSPEQARGLSVDQRTDIWSLGVVLFEALTGHPPFEGKTKSDVMAAILEREPMFVADIGEASEAVRKIVTKALQKDPNERYQTAQELLMDLRELDQPAASSDLERPLLPHVNRHLVAETAMQRAKSTDDPGVMRPPLSAEYIVSEIRQHKASVLLGLAIVAMVMTGISFWVYRQIGSNNSIERFPTMNLTRLASSGRAKGAAISPDGKYVAFVKDDGTQRGLWLRQIGTTSDIQISPQTDAGWLIFSRDGDYLYYGNFFGDISRMRVLGGTSSLVIKGVGSSISFSPDGKRFAFLRGDYPTQGESSLLVANADGSGVETVASRRQPDSFERAVAWSPDGTTIACALTHTDIQSSYTTLVQVDVKSGREEPITAHRWLEINELAWLSDGRGFLLIATDELFLQKIWHLSLRNGQARRMTNDFNIYEGLSLTADSTRIVTTQQSQAANVWLVTQGESAPKEITKRAGNYFGLSWTPSGDLVYASDRSGNWDIWLSSPDATKEKQLTINNGNLLPSVSPDGRYVFFTSIRAESVNIWRMDIDGGNPRQITNGNLDHSASCSPDGKWLIHVHETSGRSTVWKVSTDGGTPVQLTDGEAANPVFSPDGKLIACSYGNGRVAIIPFEGGTPLKVFEMPTPFVIEPGFRWTADGRALTFVDTHGGVSNIWSQPIDGGPRQQLTKFSTENIFSFAWSRDGKQLALARGVETGDVVLITDFRQAR